jgi:hypothetical protein
MGRQVSNCPNCCEEQYSLQFYRCTVFPIFVAKRRKKSTKKYNLKTMSKGYIIYEREIQEVQNTLQDVHDYNESRRQMWGKNPKKHITEARTTPHNPMAKETWVIPLRPAIG